VCSFTTNAHYYDHKAYFVLYVDLLTLCDLYSVRFVNENGWELVVGASMAIIEMIWEESREWGIEWEMKWECWNGMVGMGTWNSFPHTSNFVAN